MSQSNQVDYFPSPYLSSPCVQWSCHSSGQGWILTIEKFDLVDVKGKISQVKINPEISDFLQGIPPCFRQVSRWYYALKWETLQITELKQLIR